MNLIIPWDGSTDLNWTHLALVLLGYVSLRCFFLLGPLFFWVTKSSFAERRRVYRIAYKPQQFKNEFKSLVQNLCLDAVILATLVKSGLAIVDETHIIYSVMVSAVWFEIWFYASHRALHTRALFPIHRLHHAAQVTSPLTAMTFSAGERLVLLGGFAAGLGVASYIYPISFHGVAIYFAFNYIFTLLGHTNVEIFSPRLGLLLSWFSAPTHHALHHSRVNGNYGLHTRFLDRMFQTEFPDYMEVLASAYQGRGLVSIKQRLTPVEADSRGLCEAISATDLRGRLMHQNPAVRHKLEQQLRDFAILKDGASTTGEWHLQRGQQIHGPLSFDDLCDLRRHGAVKEDDVIFNLQSSMVYKPGRQMVVDKVSVGAAPVVYLNRRQKRDKIECVVKLGQGIAAATGITLDMNSHSAAVYSTHFLEAGSEIALEIPNNERSPALVMRTKIVHRRPFRDGYRYGLRFEGIERRTAERVKQFVKTSLKSCAAG